MPIIFLFWQVFGVHLSSTASPRELAVGSVIRMRASFKGYCPGGDNSVSTSSLINDSQNAKLSTKFSKLNKDFSEMRKFQAKPLKPRCDTGLKTTNPEGFWITPKSRKVRGHQSHPPQISRGGVPGMFRHRQYSTL